MSHVRLTYPQPPVHIHTYQLINNIYYSFSALPSDTLSNHHHHYSPSLNPTSILAHSLRNPITTNHSAHRQPIMEYYLPHVLTRVAVPHSARQVFGCPSENASSLSNPAVGVHTSQTTGASLTQTHTAKTQAIGPPINSRSSPLPLYPHHSLYILPPSLPPSVLGLPNPRI